MPFSFRIDEELDLLCIEAEGLLTPELLHECMEACIAAPAFRPDLDVLISIGDTATVEINGREQTPVVLAKENVLRDAANVLASGRRDTPHRVACAGGTSKVRTFAVAAAGLMDRQSEIAAFEEVPEALEWLGQGQ